VRLAQIWVKCFQSRNLNVKDARRSGRPVTYKMDAIFEKKWSNIGISVVKT